MMSKKGARRNRFRWGLRRRSHRGFSPATNALGGDTRGMMIGVRSQVEFKKFCTKSITQLRSGLKFPNRVNFDHVPGVLLSTRSPRSCTQLELHLSHTTTETTISSSTSRALAMRQLQNSQAHPSSISSQEFNPAASSWTRSGSRSFLLSSGLVCRRQTCARHESTTYSTSARFLRSLTAVIQRISSGFCTSLRDQVDNT